MKRLLKILGVSILLLIVFSIISLLTNLICELFPALSFIVLIIIVIYFAYNLTDE